MPVEPGHEPARVDLATLARSCSECPMCRYACPAAETLQREVSAPRSWALVARRALQGATALDGRAGEPDECTGCGRCVDFCYAHYPLPLLLSAAVGIPPTTHSMTLEGSWYLGLMVDRRRSAHEREHRLDLPTSRVGSARVELTGSARVTVDPILGRAVVAGPGVTVVPDASWRRRAGAGQSATLLLRCCFESAAAVSEEGDPPTAEDALGGWWCCGAAAGSPAAAAEMAHTLVRRARAAGFTALVATSEACACHLAGVDAPGISVL